MSCISRPVASQNLKTCRITEWYAARVHVKNSSPHYIPCYINVIIQLVFPSPFFPAAIRATLNRPPSFYQSKMVALFAVATSVLLALPAGMPTSISRV